MACRSDVSPTAKQKRFTDEYLIDRNGTQAAIRAGYSKKTANEQASRLLAKVNVKKFLSKKEVRLQEKIEITQEFILNRLKHISDFNSAEIQVPLGNGDNSIIVSKMRDANAANKSTELLGKHLGLFTEKVEVTGKDGKDLIDKSGDLAELARKIAFTLESATRN